MDFLLLTLLVELYLSHLSIAQNVIQPSNLAEGVFRYHPEGTERAVTDTLRFPAAHITLDGQVTVFMGVDSPERTRLHAFEAGNTGFLIELDNPVQQVDRIGGAYLSAGGYLALAADNGHSNYGMGVSIDYSYCRFFWIVNSKMLDGAYQLADTASRALLRNDGKFS